MRIFWYGKLVDSIDHYYSDKGLIAVKKTVEKQEKKINTQLFRRPVVATCRQSQSCQLFAPT